MAGLTLAVVAEGHLGLAEANCVLSRAGAIELLELGLLDILWYSLSASLLMGLPLILSGEGRGGGRVAPCHGGQGQKRGARQTWLGK